MTYDDFVVEFGRTNKIGVLLSNKDINKNPEKFFMFLLKLGFIPSKQFLEKAPRIKNLNKILDFFIAYKKQDKNWQNTLFGDYENVVGKVPDVVLRIETLLHYFTTYGAEFLEMDIPTYFPNEQTKIGKREIKKFLKEIDVSTEDMANFLIVDIEAPHILRQIVVEKLVYTNTPLTEMEMEYLKKRLIDAKGIEFDVNRIKFSEVKTLVLDSGNRNIKNLEYFDVLRWACYKITDKPILLNSKDLDKMADFISDDIKNTFWKLLGVVNYDKISKGYKQKRKLSNKIFQIMAIKEFKNKYDAAKFAKTLKNGNAGIKRVQTDYAIFSRLMKRDKKRAIELYPHIALEKYNQFNWTLKDTVYLMEHLSTKLQLRLFNVIRMSEEMYDFGVYKLPNGKIYVRDDILTKTPKFKTYTNNFWDVILKNKPTVRVNISPELREYVENVVNMKIPLTVRDVGDGLEFERGSYITLKYDERYNVGVYWKNQKGHRIDLDLAFRYYDKDFSSSNVIGWNGSYGSGDGLDIKFSGDITDAPKGAAEFISFTNVNEPLFGIFAVNWFNSGYSNKMKVRFDLFINEKRNMRGHVNPATSLFFNTRFLDNENSYVSLGIMDFERGWFFPVSGNMNLRPGSSLKGMSETSFIIRTMIEKEYRKVDCNEFFQSAVKRKKIELVNDIENVDYVIKDINQFKNFVVEYLGL